MLSQTVLISVLVAIAEARFGQEQLPIGAIGAVTSGGESGQAATLAGASISTLLGAANPCDKLKQADLIVATLGTGADSIAAAKGLVAAEQNFNPFAVTIPAICNDPSLPVTEALRGIVPLVDPAVDGSDVENANSAASLTTPFDSAGLSVADIMAANGFTSFSTKDAAGTVGAAPAAGNGGGAADPAPASSVAPVVDDVPAATSVADAAPCGTTLVTVTRAAPAATTIAEAAPVATEDPAMDDGAAGGDAGGATGGSDLGAAGVDPGFQTSSLGLNFGTCTPTIKFEAGLNGRKETELTFQAIDPVVNKGQQEALNPNIITKRICDQLGNVCGASADGIAACTAAKATILALSTRDQSTADAWNEALGFAGTDTNPDGAPKAGLVGHT